MLPPKACIISHSPASGAVIHHVSWKLVCFYFIILFYVCFSTSVVLTSSDGGILRCSSCDFVLFLFFLLYLAESSLLSPFYLPVRLPNLNDSV